MKIPFLPLRDHIWIKIVLGAVGPGTIYAAYDYVRSDYEVALDTIWGAATAGLAVAVILLN